MISKEFLKERLFKIFTSIRNINIKYQYIREGNLHVAEITPGHELENNLEYKAQKSRLIQEFTQRFLSEKLMIVDENSIRRVDLPEFSFTKINGKTLIETRSVKNYAPSFTLTVTRENEKYESLSRNG